MANKEKEKNADHWEKDITLSTLIPSNFTIHTDLIELNKQHKLYSTESCNKNTNPPVGSKRKLYEIESNRETKEVFLNQTPQHISNSFDIEKEKEEKAEEPVPSVGLNYYEGAPIEIQPSPIFTSKANSSEGLSRFEALSIRHDWERIKEIHCNRIDNIKRINKTMQQRNPPQSPLSATLWQHQKTEELKPEINRYNLEEYELNERKIQQVKSSSYQNIHAMQNLRFRTPIFQNLQYTNVDRPVLETPYPQHITDNNSNIDDEYQSHINYNSNQQGIRIHTREIEHQIELEERFTHTGINKRSKEEIYRQSNLEKIYNKLQSLEEYYNDLYNDIVLSNAAQKREQQTRLLSSSASQCKTNSTSCNEDTNEETELTIKKSKYMLEERVRLNGNVCIVCGKNTQMFCSVCEKEYYCSAECQLSDWAIHSNVCKQHA